MNTLYHFNPATGAYTKSSEASLDPIDKMPMVPANSTLTKPPKIWENKVAVWDDDGWEVQPDHRGTEYWLVDGTKHTISVIGMELPEGALDEAPPRPLAELKAEALAGAHEKARGVRLHIAGAASTERAIGWVLKALFAGVWQINEQAPNPLLKPLADVAEQGFGIETELTGEDPKAIRDRSVEKAGAFFVALQLVEGIERVAESQIGAAETPESLEATVAQLQSLEEQAMAKLENLGKS